MIKKTDYISLIKGWGEKTKISTNGKLEAQILKFISEYSEYREHMDNNKPIADDIGDMIVVLVMISGLANIDTSKVLVHSDFNMITGTTEQMIGRHLGLLTDGFLKGNDLEVAIRKIYADIYNVAKRYNYKLDVCLKTAWEDIKDREGIMTKSGVFVKSTDAEYARIVEEESK